jgi:hypothetical protein
MLPSGGPGNGSVGGVAGDLGVLGEKLTRGISPAKPLKLRGTGDTERAYPERDLVSELVLLSTASG